jgi:hypothetical protein
VVFLSSLPLLLYAAERYRDEPALLAHLGRVNEVLAVCGRGGVGVALQCPLVLLVAESFLPLHSGTSNSDEGITYESVW